MTYDMGDAIVLGLVVVLGVAVVVVQSLVWFGLIRHWWKGTH